MVFVLYLLDSFAMMMFVPYPYPPTISTYSPILSYPSSYPSSPTLRSYYHIILLSSFILLFYPIHRSVPHFVQPIHSHFPPPPASDSVRLHFFAVYLPDVVVCVVTVSSPSLPYHHHTTIAALHFGLVCV